MSEAVKLAEAITRVYMERQDLLDRLHAAERERNAARETATYMTAKVAEIDTERLVLLDERDAARAQANWEKNERLAIKRDAIRLVEEAQMLMRPQAEWESEIGSLRAELDAARADLHAARAVVEAAREIKEAAIAQGNPEAILIETGAIRRLASLLKVYDEVKNGRSSD